MAERHAQFGMVSFIRNKLVTIAGISSIRSVHSEITGSVESEMGGSVGCEIFIGKTIMFNFLKSNKKHEPLDKKRRKYFENNFLWLMQEFPEPKFEERRILTPTTADFPRKWNKSR